MSLETPVDEEDSSLGDFIEDKNNSSTFRYNNSIKSNKSTTKIIMTPREEGSFKNEIWNWNEYRSYFGRLVYSFQLQEKNKTKVRQKL